MPTSDRCIKAIIPDKFHTFLILPFLFKGENSKLTSVKLAEHYNKYNRWESEEFEVNDGLRYNEFLYFYPYVRKILYSKKNNKTSSMQFLRWKKGEKDQWKLRVVGNEYDHTMDIIDAFLHLYDMGVGVFVLEIAEENLTKDIRNYITFLDLARRIYVPFINPKYKFKDEDPEHYPFDAITGKQCPKKIIILKNKEEVCTQNFECKVSQPNSPELLSNVVKHFLDIYNDEFTFTFNPSPGGMKSNSYQTFVDDRMFVHTYFSIDKSKFPSNNGYFLHNLSEYFNINPSHTELNKYWSTDIWYRMIFIDSGEKSCQNDIMQKKIIDDSTYTRWTKFKTFYGYSRFSSMMMTDSGVPDYLYNHFQTMYYQIAMVLFFYRGVLLNFSMRSSDISHLLAVDGKERKKGIEQARELHSDFLAFRNRCWFREITAQDQGIEIFNLWNRKLDNVELMKDIESEIEGLYRFVNYEQEQRENDQLRNISILGAILLPITVTTGFFGMNLINSFKGAWWLFSVLTLIFIVISVTLITCKKGESLKNYQDRIEKFFKDKIE
ncbi:MAG: CorA family divalent cation transporter [Candidatus Hatepunaea meridiana]|nr:CorA family divalent cation transporter [Candidatus Hatepunaea meridiana]